MGKKLLVFVAAMVILSACGIPATPMTSPTNMAGTAVSTVSTATAVLQLTSLTATPISLAPAAFTTAGSISPAKLPASPTPLLFTDPSISLSEWIVYYYFVTPAEDPAPDGSVMISSIYILAPTFFRDTAYSPDTADNLRTALAAVLNDRRNGWIGNKLEIVNVTLARRTT